MSKKKNQLRDFIAGDLKYVSPMLMGPLRGLLFCPLGLS